LRKQVKFEKQNFINPNIVTKFRIAWHRSLYFLFTNTYILSSCVWIVTLLDDGR